jgi:hypothetical protein
VCDPNLRFFFNYQQSKKKKVLYMFSVKPVNGFPTFPFWQCHWLVNSKGQSEMNPYVALLDVCVYRQTNEYTKDPTNISEILTTWIKLINVISNIIKIRFRDPCRIKCWRVPTKNKSQVPLVHSLLFCVQNGESQTQVVSQGLKWWVKNSSGESRTQLDEL